MLDLDLGRVRGNQVGGAVGWPVGVRDRMSKCPGVNRGWQAGAATKLGCWGWKGIVFCSIGKTLSPYTYPTASASSSAFQDLRASFAPGDKVRYRSQRSRKRDRTEV